MSINIELLTRVLPCEDSYAAKTKRDQMWALCDTNQNGFISLKEIEDELLRTLSLQRSDNITVIIQKSLS